ncbi:MAG: hypothetical protein QNJ97_16700, partial [Myxococcota bacterium]|nr:hypothetical protein [Myxococcota bacterium]
SKVKFDWTCQNPPNPLFQGGDPLPGIKIAKIATFALNRMPLPFAKGGGILPDIEDWTEH